LIGDVSNNKKIAVSLKTSYGQNLKGKHKEARRNAVSEEAS
jgi:hypothetical protein